MNGRNLRAAFGFACLFTAASSLWALAENESDEIAKGSQGVAKSKAKAAAPGQFKGFPSKKAPARRVVAFRKGDQVVVLQDAVVKAGSRTVGTLSEGERFEVLDVIDDWVGVTIGGETGWVSRSALKLAEAAPAPPSFNPQIRPLRPSLTRDPRRGDLFALLIGVKEYDATELKPLQFSEADIEDLARILPGLGYSPENIAVLTQARGARRNRFAPTAAHIRKELTLLLGEAGPLDTVLIALAGHGIQFRGEERSFFCPSDAKLSDRATLVDLKEIYDSLGASRAGGKVLLVDACRNDPQSALARSRSVVNLESVTRPQSQALPGGVTALFSCSSGQQAFEHPDLKHGVFFNFVIEGLKGAADFDRDDEITLTELELFTTKRVQRFVRNELAESQVPERRGEARGLITLGTRRGAGD